MRYLVLSILVVTAMATTTPNFALALSESGNNNNNNSSIKDWNFYRANIHNLSSLNATGTLKDCSITSQAGPCWDSQYQIFVP
jgi:hypothetical protein